MSIFLLVIWAAAFVLWAVSLLFWIHSMRRDNITRMWKSVMWTAIFSVIMLILSAVNRALG